jgi:hypothetical protein
MLSLAEQLNARGWEMVRVSGFEPLREASETPVLPIELHPNGAGTARLRYRSGMANVSPSSSSFGTGLESLPGHTSTAVPPANLTSQPPEYETGALQLSYGGVKFLGAGVS